MTRTPAPVPGRPRVGAAALIVGCFVASAAIRIMDPAGPVAHAAGALAAPDTQPAAPARGGAQAECTPGGDAGALLEAVRERELQLRDRALQIADRERLLEAAEARMRAERERLEEARARLEQTLTIADDAAEADIKRLVEVYENMDPKKSSKIFQTMDIGFAAGFLARMRQDVAAEVLAGLPAERAYAISATIAGRNANAPRE
ncbi:MotE family protein [Rhodovulum sp. DZ06]|uniref:MotE family protein n=1 Tax=Rhodovulum sp. DZ06 TaxID=3425126 RepID=UPI003D331B72